ncbi:sulfotransferase [Tautonia plasticadhaerens]|nr:sulfotransferase [Tautonia plasticadhaerens]
MPFRPPSGWNISPPYNDLGRPANRARATGRDDIIFVTGRFRSGSTLLWNLFRNVEGVTAYYEPLNERRWFDRRSRGGHTDSTHRKVADYWREYDGLDDLGRWYREDWIRRDLLMAEDAWDPGLTGYVDTLIERAPGRPVLQFNRIDFRLPWFRRQYPRATFIHIYRHPRDQWCSTLQGDLIRFPRDGTMADFIPFDKFYLGTWAADLKYRFPFLEERSDAHPYRIFYYIWILSYIFGEHFCHYSIQFERFMGRPEEQLIELFDRVGIIGADLAALRLLIEPPVLGKWRQYAEAGWFEDHEAACEEVLGEFLGSTRSGVIPEPFAAHL